MRTLSLHRRIVRNTLSIALYVYSTCEVIDNKADFDFDRFSSEGICYLSVLVGSYVDKAYCCALCVLESGRVEGACQS